MQVANPGLLQEVKCFPQVFRLAVAFPGLVVTKHPQLGQELDLHIGKADNVDAYSHISMIAATPTFLIDGLDRWGRHRQAAVPVRLAVRPNPSSSAHGELLRSELLRLARLTAKQLDESLATLFQTEAVTVQDVPGKGRTGKMYRVVR